MSVFGVILVRFYPLLNWTLEGTKYLSVFSPNAGKYRPEVYLMQIQNSKIKLNVILCSESQKEIQKFLIFNFLKETRLSAISRFRHFHTERMCMCVWVRVSEGGFLKFITSLWILSFLKNRSAVHLCGWWGWGVGHKIGHVLWKP